MKKLYLTFGFLLSFSLTTHAKLIYSTGFENSSDIQGWSFINGSQTNKWMIGSGTYHSGTQSLYVSSNGSSPSYSNSSASVVWAYKTLNLKSGTHTFSFDWKCYGESTYDYFVAYIVPASSGLPTAGSTSVPSGSILSSSKLNQQSTWQSYSANFTVSNAGNYNILFMWRNDASSGSTPPACIDNVKIDRSERFVFIPVTSSDQLNKADSCDVVFVNEINETTWYTPYFYSTNSYLKPESCKSTTWFNTTYDTIFIDSQGTYKRDIWRIYKNNGDGTIIQSFSNPDQCWGASSETNNYTYTYSKTSYRTNVRKYSFTRYVDGKFTINWIGMYDPSSTQSVNTSYDRVYYYSTAYYYNGSNQDLSSYRYRIYRKATCITFNTDQLDYYVNYKTNSQYVFDDINLPMITINPSYASQVEIDGWYNEQGIKVGNVGEDITINSDSILILKLKGKTSSPYTVTYNVGYYGVNIPSVTTTDKIELPAITFVDPSDASKVEFLGWYDEDGNYVGLDGDSIKVYSNLNLKAMFGAINNPAQTYFKRVKTKDDLKSEKEMNVIFVNTYSTSTYYAAKSYNQSVTANTSYNVVTPVASYYPTNGTSTTSTWVSLASGKDEFVLDLSQTTTSYNNHHFVWKISGADNTLVNGYNGFWSSYATSSKFNYTSYPYIYTRQQGYNGGANDQYICRFNIIPSETFANSLIEWADWDNSTYRFFYANGTSGFRAGTNTTSYRQFDIYRQAYKVSFDVDEELAAYGSSKAQELAFDSIVLPQFKFTHADYANNVTLLGWVDENGNVYQPGDKIAVNRNIDFHMSYSIHKYTITFDAGDHGTCTTEKVTSLLPFALPDVECEGGYYFQGWASSINDKIVGKGGAIYPSGANTLTYDDDLYAVYQQSYNVMEWGTNSVMLEFLYGATTAVTRTTNGTSKNNILSNCQVDKGIYRLQVTPGDLTNDEGLELEIIFKDAYGAVVSQAITKIPIIVSTPENITDIHDYSICAQTDLVVVNGGVAKAGITPYRFNNIRIQAGGKLVVPSGTSLTTDNIYMTAGYVENERYQFIYPQLVANGSINNSSGKIYYDYWMNEAQYYNLALPYEVNIAEIKYQDGKSLPLNTNLWIAVYNGMTRSTGASGWEDFNGSKLNAGIGYTVAATPQTVRIVGGAAAQRKYAIVRFPMSANLTNGETTTDKSIAVTPYPSQTGKDNDAGWNLVGNPFLANYGGNVDGLSNSNGIGLLVEDGTGGYTWQGKVRYVIMPNDNGTSYLPILATSTMLPAFKNFFIQIGSGDALNFSLVNRAQKAPMYEENVDEENIITTGIVLSRNEFSDPVGVVIGDNYTSEYEINADLQKWNNTNGFNFYALSSSERLSFIALDNVLAKNIALGYSVPEYGTYYISLDTTYTNTELEAIYLTDTKRNKVTNLLVENYKFSLGQAETNNNRFTLAVVKKAPGVTTGFDYINEASCFATSENSILTMHSLIGEKLTIYNTIGQKVIDTNITGTTMSFVLSAGTYLICVQSNSSSTTFKAIVR